MANSANKKLGRGLSALLGNAKTEFLHKNSFSPDSENGEQIAEIELKKIIPGIYQPRHKFDSQELENLAISIKESGVIQPIILRQKEGEQKFEIIAGERRFRASQLAGLSKIPSIIKKISNRQALEIAIVENIQRNDLLLTEEAEAYQRLIKEFSYTQEDMAKKLGKSRSHITNLLRILSLPKMVLDLVDDKKLSMGHARAIIGAKNVENLANSIISKSYTVRDVEELMRNQKQQKNQDSIKKSNKKPSSNQRTELSQIKELEQKITKSSGLKVKIFYDAQQKKGEIRLQFKEIKSLEKALGPVLSM